MISRRNALMLGAAGLALPSLGLSAAASASDMAEESGNSVPMFRGNAARTGEMPGPAPSLDKPIVVRWSFTTDWGIMASPVIFNNTVYIGSGDGNFYALDAISGEEIWRFTTDGGINHTAALAVDTVIFGSRDNVLYAVDTATGQERWRFSGGEGDWYSPAVSEGFVYVCGRSGLHAISVSTGEELWRIGEFNQDQTPVVDSGTIYISGGGLVALDALTGEERWLFTIPDNSISISPPAVVNEKIYTCSGDVFVGEGGMIHALDSLTGEELWRYSTSVFGGVLSPSPAVFDGIVYASGLDGFGLHALDSNTGRPIWSIESGGPANVADGTLFYRGAGSQFLWAVDAVSGIELWKFHTGVGGEPAIINGMVYITDLSSEGDGLIGTLYALGNPMTTRLISDATIRGAPSHSGIERGKFPSGTEVTQIGNRELRDGESWVEVTIDSVTGWIPLDAIDLATLPPEGEIEYVYVPD